MAFKSNILKSLQEQFREYYRNGRGGENLTFEQRRLLDAVRDNPQPAQLEALSSYLIGAGEDSQIAEDALYNAGVAIGATRRRVGDFWQRLTQQSDFVDFIPLEGSQAIRVPKGTGEEQTTANTPDRPTPEQAQRGSRQSYT